MPNPIFPTLTNAPDSSKYGLEVEDPSMKTEMDGGYVVSRAKHTRTPRKKFSTGYTMLKNTDRDTLQAFYNTVRGGSVIFDWTDPASLVVYQVRFAAALTFTYTGVGTSQRWDVVLRLEQA
jgi:hypothetical protein